MGAERSVHQQISQLMLSRIQKLGETDESLRPPHALGKTNKSLRPPHAEKLSQLTEKHPKMIEKAMGSFSHLSAEYNDLAGTNSTILPIFPRSQKLKEILTEHTGKPTLPSFEELKKEPHWDAILAEGIEDAARLMELGIFAATKSDDATTTSQLNEWFARLHVVPISSPSRKDIGAKTRLVAIESHVVERIYFAWLKGKGFDGKRDDIISVFNEMIQYKNLQGKPSPLEKSYRKLGWMKQERLEQRRTQLSSVDIIKNE